MDQVHVQFYHHLHLNLTNDYKENTIFYPILEHLLLLLLNASLYLEINN